MIARTFKTSSPAWAIPFLSLCLIFAVSIYYTKHWQSHKSTYFVCKCSIP